MKHRDTRVALLGVVAGIILGASALAIGQQSAQATVIVPGYGTQTSAVYTRRSITKTLIPVRNVDNVPTVKTQESSSTVAAAPADPTPCSASLATAMKIKAVYNAVVPVNIKTTDMRQKLDAVFVDVMDDYCQQAAASSAMSSSVASVVTNNHCEKYSKLSVRYTQCTLADQYGRKYP